MITQIFFAKISPVWENITDDLIKMVSSERQARLAKFRFDIDRKLSLYGELLVRYQICKLLDLDNKGIMFTKNKSGKPYLQNYPEFHFNISHTRNAIAVAFSNSEIGIDIEKIKSPDFKIAKRFFTSSEQNYIFTQENSERAFYEIWTKKEAYIKYTGTGLSVSLKSFNVLDDKNTTMSYMVEIEDYILSSFCEKFIKEEPTVTVLTENDLQIFLEKITTHQI